VTADVSSAPPRQVTAGKLFKAVRAFSLPVSVLPVFLATAAVLRPSQWRWDVLICAAVGAGLLHCAGNLLNDYFDFLSKVDRRTRDDDFRPGRLLVYRLLLPRDVMIEAIVCLAAVAAISGYLIWQCGPGLVGFVLAAVAGLYAYTGPPFRLKYHALGEAVIFVTFGPLLMLGAAWVQTGRLELTALLLSLPVGLATTAILVGNNFRDRQEDAQAGIKTIGHFAGGNVARFTYLATVISSTLAVAAIAAAGRGPRPLIFAPLTLGLLAKPLRFILKGQRLPDIDAQTARFETILLLGVLATYVVAGSL